MKPKSETSCLGQSGSEAPNRRLPLSRRNVLKSLLVAPIGLPFVIGQSQKGQPSTNCCHGGYKPDDLFAATSLVGDLQRARRGELTATLRVGFAYYTGMAGIRDIPRARAYFVVASRSSAAGCAWLGYLDAAAHIKPGAAARRSDSFKGLVEAAQAGDPVGQTLLGRVYERGLAGYKPRPDKAQPLYVAAAPDFALAKTCWGRLLVKAGAYDKARLLFEQAAAVGETTGMIALADLDSRMKGPKPRVSEMKRWLRKAGKKGDAVALYLYGIQYQKGTLGFGANPQRALKLLHQSARRGYKPAQDALATAYANGLGVTASAGSARFWARKASLPSLNKPGPPGPALRRSVTAS